MEKVQKDAATALVSASAALLEENDVHELPAEQDAAALLASSISIAMYWALDTGAGLEWGDAEM